MSLYGVVKNYLGQSGEAIITKGGGMGILNRIKILIYVHKKQIREEQCNEKEMVD